jgi:hypothetical protein
MTSAERKEDMGMLLTISGGYHSKGDLHPYLRIDAPDRIVAAVYCVDDDWQRAEKEAKAIVGALAPRSDEPQKPGTLRSEADVTQNSHTVQKEGAVEEPVGWINPVFLVERRAEACKAALLSKELSHD